MVSEIRGTAALVLNSFGVFSHYAGTQKRGGGPRVPSYTMVFVEGYERLLDGINASFCVCHPTVNYYNLVSGSPCFEAMMIDQPHVLSWLRNAGYAKIAVLGGDHVYAWD